MTRPAPKKYARKKRATRRATMASSGGGIQIPPLPIGSVVKYGLMLLALAVGYGKMQSDVGHLKTDVTDMKEQVKAIYDHLAFRESGKVGPVILPQGE